MELKCPGLCKEPLKSLTTVPVFLVFQTMSCGSLIRRQCHSTVNDVAIHKSNQYQAVYDGNILLHWLLPDFINLQTLELFFKDLPMAINCSQLSVHGTLA